MLSPLFYAKFIGTTIDLSQLAEVGDAFFADYHEPYRCEVVGFRYRYIATPGNEWHTYVRPLIMGPRRNQEYQLEDPSLIMETAVEEIYKRRITLKHKNGETEMVYDEKVIVKKDGESIALLRMRDQVENLREAWAKWKAAEPEVYAIIRKHLS